MQWHSLLSVVQCPSKACALNRKCLGLLIRCISLCLSVSLSLSLLSHTHPLTIFQAVLLTIMGSLYEVVVHMKHSGWASYLQIRRTTGHRPMTETTSDSLHDWAESPSCTKHPKTTANLKLHYQIRDATDHPCGRNNKYKKILRQDNAGKTCLFCALVSFEN